MKSAYQRHTCMPMFIAELFTIAEIWNHILNEWIKKYYSIVKKNEILSFVLKWVELEDTMLSEIS
jgi:hypothetical protein